MIYKKTNAGLAFSDFMNLVLPIVNFNSLTGKEYQVIRVEETIIHFIRKSSGKNWAMDFKQVLKAYQELTDFKTENFRPYVPRTHSPALGLLLHLELLKK